MDPTKIAAIHNWDTLTKKKELQRFLRFCNHYRRFIKNYSLLYNPSPFSPEISNGNGPKMNTLLLNASSMQSHQNPSSRFCVRKDNFILKQTHLIMLLAQYYRNFKMDVGILSHSCQKLYRKPNKTMKFMTRNARHYARIRRMAPLSRRRRRSLRGLDRPPKPSIFPRTTKTQSLTSSLDFGNG